MPLKSNATDGPITRTRLSAYVTAHEKVSAVALADAAATLTAAQLVDSKLFTITPTAARNLTTATAAQILTQLTDEEVGTSFEFTIVNLASSSHAVTLVGGTTVTVVGNAEVAHGASGTFVGVVTSSTAVSIYRK
jgi:hypothetical protein